MVNCLLLFCSTLVVRSSAMRLYVDFIFSMLSIYSHAL